MTGKVTGRKASADRVVPDALTRVRRLADRAVYDLQVMREILDAATHCHVAHVIDGRPVATPMLQWRVDDRVYWHGSVASRMLKAQAAGAEVCLTVTIFDGWVLARSAFNHSANYRSVMIFGRPRQVEDAAEKLRLLQAFSDHWFPGRWDRLRPVHRKELAATAVFSLPLTRASAKVRTGGPDDPPRDRDWPIWAGAIPVRVSYGAAQPAPDLPGRMQPARVRKPSMPSPAVRQAQKKNPAKAG